MTLFPPDPPDPTKTYGPPHAATSGWSGSDTSRERAEVADATGVTHERDDKTLAALAHAEAYGLTWFELSDSQGLHHGEASGVLSRLHQHGRAARLKGVRRGRGGKGKQSEVYVLPEFVHDRPVAEYRPNVSKKWVFKIASEAADCFKAGDTKRGQFLLGLLIDRFRP